MEIKATLHAIDHPEYRCGTCLTKYRGRKDAEQMTQAMRQNKGCQDVKPAPIHRIGEDLKFTTCIGNFYRPGVVSWLEMQGHFEKGVLPYPGALSDQPAKAIEIFRLIEAHKAERAEKERKRIAQEQRRAAQGVSRGR